MNKKLKYTLIIVAGLLSLVIGVIIGDTISIKKSLPFFRYKNITEYDIERNFSFTVVKGSDGRFYHKGIYNERKREHLIPWIGDDLNVIVFSDSIINFDPQNQFSGFDSSIVSFSGDEILPKRPGNTLLVVKWRSLVDTNYLNLKQMNGNYSIEVRK